MDILRKDSAFNFFPVLHLQRYINGHKGYVAGGCFKNIFKNEQFKDVDVFFENEDDFDEALKKFENNAYYTKIYENENAVGFFDEKFKIAVDLVRSEFFNPEQMIRSFDFTITKFALYKEKVKNDENQDDENEKYELKVVYHRDFFEHLTLNRLVIDENEIKFPLNTFDRMLRYAKYGYAPCTGTKAKIVRAINAVSLPDDNDNLFKGFYAGID